MVETHANPEQQAAIELTEGPLRIMAGAGTGKTSTLTRRIVHLITSGLARPSEILALTFTNKAVDELRSRVGEAVGNACVAATVDGERVDIDTYHAFGSRVVEEFGSRLGLPSEPVVLTKAESWIILWNALDDIGLEYLDFGAIAGYFGISPLHKIIDTGSRLSDELKTLGDLQAWLGVTEDSGQAETLSDTLRALSYYQTRKNELGAIDFGDQIAMACQLLSEPDIAQIFGRRYRYIMVDEFQDTNFAQRVMIQRLVGDNHRNICVVGDPNQAIYAFRGAAPDNLDRFADEDFPDAKTLTLSANYRSTQEILDLANAIWEDGEHSFRGNLLSARAAHGPKPLLVEAVGVDDELAYIATKITELVESGDHVYGDIAVIARKTRVKHQIFSTLRNYGIPAELVGGTSLYALPEIREIVSWLRAAANHRHDAAFAYLLLSERCGMDERDLYELSQRREQDESLQDTARRLVLAGEASDTLTNLVATLSFLVQRSYAGLEPLLAAIVDLRQGASDLVEADNIERFSEVVRTFASSRLGTPDLRDLNAWLELIFLAGPEEEAATGFDPGVTNRVTVITAHAAKGLQWPVVFVACANHHDFFNQGRIRPETLPYELLHEEPERPERDEFPADPKGGKTYDKALREWQRTLAREEEFRTLYVALTRAERQLIISWALNAPSRKDATKVHPALLDVAAYCEQLTAPPASERGAPVRLKMIAPQLIARLAPILGIAGGEPAPEVVASTLDAAAVEFGLPIEQLDMAWQQFRLEKRQLQGYLADLTLAEELATRQEETDPQADGLFFVSFTQLESWNRCPHQYFLNYVRQVPGAPKRWATGYGSALHRVLQGESERRRIGLETNEDELRAALARDPESRIGTGEWEPSFGQIDPIEAYQRSPDATAEVLLVEQGFTLRLGDRVAISGVIDKVHRLPDGSSEVVDYKSNKRASSAEEVRAGLQLPIYLMACRELFPEIQPAPERAVLFNLRHNKRTAVSWTPAELGVIRQQIETTANTMRSPDPALHRASPETCRWCDYRETCEFTAYRG